MSSLIWKSLSQQADRIADGALSGIHTLDDWKAELPARRLELRRSLGLEPWPENAQDIPKVREYGEFHGEGFRARKIGYELLPDCWGAATIYYPDPPPGKKHPAVLYSCGHTQTGSWHFQSHPILWARRGYVCLILDSAEQNDNPGEHHGFNLHLHHKRLALGYVASGGEAFNNIRALDLLAVDPAVDAARLGMTGVSGGGAMSWLVAALDERIRAVSTLCGISSPRDAITNRHLFGHCDCMFPLNLFQRDAADFAALIAPRAALFGFGKQDFGYHIGESISIAGRAGRIWDLHGKSGHWQLLVADCPHGDHPDFDVATQRWFDLHLAGEERPLLERGGQDYPECITSVFNGSPPSPNRLALQPELSRPRGSVPLPKTPEEWRVTRGEVLQSLQAVLLRDVESTLKADESWRSEIKTTSWHRGSIEAVDVFLEVRTPNSRTANLLLSTATGGQIAHHVVPSILSVLERNDSACALFEPRLSGWNYAGVGGPCFPAGSNLEIETRLTKAMMLVGTTPVGMFYQDIRAAVAYLRTRTEFAECRLFLHGKGESALASLLVALVDEHIAGVVLEDLPGSFEDRCPVMGILRVLDIPQAVGLLAPRPVVLVNPGDTNWSWPVRAYKRLQASRNFNRAADMRVAFQHILL